MRYWYSSWRLEGRQEDTQYNKWELPMYASFGQILVLNLFKCLSEF